MVNDGSEVVVGGRKANAPVFGLQMHSERASKSVDTLVLDDVVIMVSDDDVCAAFYYNYY